MTLKIYGMSASRTSRNLWMAEELGIAYEHIPVKIADAASDPDIARLNPNLRIPVIEDDGVVITESMAINLYLAAKHGGPLAAGNAAEAGLMAQWSFWAVTDLEALSLTVLMHRLVLRGEARDAARAEAAEASLARPLAVLDKALSQGDGWLVGGRFTVADLNVSSIVHWLAAARMDLSGVPNVADWVKRCRDRDAAKTAQKLP
jgi:glutathione S-transferase